MYIPETKVKNLVSFSFDLIGITISWIYISWLVFEIYIFFWGQDGNIYEWKINENNIIYCNTVGLFSHILGIYTKKLIFFSIFAFIYDKILNSQYYKKYL